jgi:hypothetical protein
VKTRYYLFGGQVAAPAYRWKGYTLPGLTRNAAETRGLSGGLGDEEAEYLPYRASGPEPLDPGEGGLGGFLNSGFTGLLPPYLEVGVLALGAALLAKRFLKR